MSGEDGQPATSGLMKDFDVLAPPKRTARLGGEDIDVSFVSARVALKFIEFSQKYDIADLKNSDSIEAGIMEDIIEVIALLCKRSAPTIT